MKTLTRALHLRLDDNKVLPVVFHAREDHLDKVVLNYDETRAPDVILVDWVRHAFRTNLHAIVSKANVLERISDRVSDSKSNILPKLYKGKLKY